MRHTKYRDRIEILRSILEAANGGDTKSRIMYKTFLSYAQMKQYFVPLIKNNLLRYDFDARTYKTTEKGLDFVELNNRLEDLINAEEQRHQLQLQL